MYAMSSMDIIIIIIIIIIIRIKTCAFWYFKSEEFALDQWP